MATMDYSTYSDEELKQALDGVNGDKYPEIQAALRAEKAARDSAPLSRPKPDIKPSEAIADYASYSDVELDQALTSVNGEKYPKIEQALRAEKAKRDRRETDVPVQTFLERMMWPDSPVHSAAESEPVPDSIAEENAASMSAAHRADQAANRAPVSVSESTASSVASREATSLNHVWAKRVALYILITASMPLMNSFSSLSLMPILMDLLFAGLSVVAGTGVLNNKSWGVNACIAILALQVCRVTASGVT
ncbi:MAG: hypothetical protein AAGJ86_12855, partial [Pseudomonadota bacterium]